MGLGAPGASQRSFRLFPPQPATPLPRHFLSHTPARPLGSLPHLWKGCEVRDGAGGVKDANQLRRAPGSSPSFRDMSACSPATNTAPRRHRGTPGAARTPCCFCPRSQASGPWQQKCLRSEVRVQRRVNPCWVFLPSLRVKDGRVCFKLKQQHTVDPAPRGPRKPLCGDP